MNRLRRWRPVLAALFVAAVLVLLAHPLAGADVFGNVGPGSSGGGIVNRYPLDHYGLDHDFTAVSVSLTGGVDVSGVPSLIAYFLANALWEGTAWLAKILISVFGFAFNLDLLNGSKATGGEGALGPVAASIHSIYSRVFGEPWLVLAISVVSMWAMWRALIQRRYVETAGALALSLVYLVVALAFVAQPALTIGSASKWTNEMSAAFLSISSKGRITDADEAREGGEDALFSQLVYKPWAVLEFGGTEHCVKSGTGDKDHDPLSVPVRPLSSSLSTQLENGTEVSGEGKTCINDLNKYAPHFLPFQADSDERNAEYDALDHGDVGRLPEQDEDRAGYRLGIADKPATDAMEAGGQGQRLEAAAVIFVGELGAFLLIGYLSIGVILAQVLLLLVLAFAPVALVFAVIPGRGHDFFVDWLIQLASLLVRKAVYSLILALILAVNAAIADATSQLGWLMSWGLQALFFWAVFFQRRKLAGSIVGATTGRNSESDGEEFGRALTRRARIGTVTRAAGRSGRTAGRAARSGGRMLGWSAQRIKDLTRPL